MIEVDCTQSCVNITFVDDVSVIEVHTVTLSESMEDEYDSDSEDETSYPDDEELQLAKHV